MLRKFSWRKAKIASGILISVVVALSSMLIFKSSEAAPPMQIPPEIVFVEVCITDLQLSIAPDGLSGYIFEVMVPVTGTTTSDVQIDDTNFPLNGVAPVQAVSIRGVDLNGNIQAGAVDTTLFTISPCIVKATVITLDDDLGNPILPPGTVVFP